MVTYKRIILFLSNETIKYYIHLQSYTLILRHINMIEINQCLNSHGSHSKSHKISILKLSTFRGQCFMKVFFQADLSERLPWSNNLPKKTHLVFILSQLYKKLIFLEQYHFYKKSNTFLCSK